MEQRHAVAHKNLIKCELQEVDPTSVIPDIRDEQSYVATQTTGGQFWRDETGALVRWPWLSGSGDDQHIYTLPQRRNPSRIDDLVNRALDKATSDGKRGYEKTGMRAWRAFCQDEGITPDRPMDPHAPLWARLNEEWTAMRFVCGLVDERGISPSSAAVYFGHVQGFHAREFGVKLAGGLKLERLPQMLKGLRRIYGSGPARVRRGISPQSLQQGMDILYSPDVPEHATIRAALSVAFTGLLRGAEFAVAPGSSWRKEINLARGDIVELTLRRLVIMMHPCKNMHHLTGKSVPLVLGAGGTFIDPVREIINMIRLNPVEEHLKASTPLFIKADGQALTTDDVMDIIRRIISVVNDDPTEFGTHSLRIGGATALFAAGADPTLIRTMGRWSSDIYRLYVRACFQRCADWTAKAGSTPVTDSVVEFGEVEHY